jgi:hypothetical protein
MARRCDAFGISSMRNSCQDSGAALRAYPEQVSTGSRGYLGKFGFVSESLQSVKVEPFAVSMSRSCIQCSQRPEVWEFMLTQCGLGGAEGEAAAGALGVAAGVSGTIIGFLKRDSLMVTLTSILSTITF